MFVEKVAIFAKKYRCLLLTLFYHFGSCKFNLYIFNLRSSDVLHDVGFVGTFAQTAGLNESFSRSLSMEIFGRDAKRGNRGKSKKKK